MNNYGYASNYIMGQIKRMAVYNCGYDQGLYDLMSRDPEYIIKTLVYTAQGYFGTQAKYEAVMFMMEGPKYFPSNIYIPVRKEISDNWMYIVDYEFYNVFCNNLNSSMHLGIDDVDRMLAFMNYDRMYDAYDTMVHDTTKFILGFIRSIHYDLLQKYSVNFLVDEDSLKNYVIEDLHFEAEDIYMQGMRLEPVQYMEFTTILLNVVNSTGEDIDKCIESAIQVHLGAVYEKHGMISFYNDPFRKIIETKVFQFIVELIYDLFENIMEYLIVTPNIQDIPYEYMDQHRLNLGKAIRILTLPLTETGVYHVM